jgi:hypothetical protein
MAIGGNDIAIRGGSNPYALWDGALGNDRGGGASDDGRAGSRRARPAVIDFTAWLSRRELADRVVFTDDPYCHRGG